jgi:hypothetical protein
MRCDVTYDLSSVDQYVETSADDLVPADDEAARTLATVIAFEATIYGLPAVLQYAQMSTQLAGRGGALNTFLHGPSTADPVFAAFRVPNVDTLYSNVWFDLSSGPVIVRLPDFGDRYFTLNLFDAHSNASNISVRTHGRGPHRVLLALPDWDGHVPDGHLVHRVATPIMWGLLRIQVSSPDEIDPVRSLQQQVEVSPPGAEHPRHWPSVSPEGVEADCFEFLQALDAVIRTCGTPVSEQALVRRFGTIGVGRPDGWDSSGLAGPLVDGIRAGFDQAMKVVRASRRQLGVEVGNGWTKVSDKGRHGQNYTARAVMNFVGLGANVDDENTSFNTYLDSDRVALDGGRSSYSLVLPTPPPVRHFWSVTVYDADTGRLCPNSARRHAVGSATGLTSRGDGSIEIELRRDDPGDERNWLPIPDGPFFLVMRAYGPQPALLSGAWTPSGVRRVRTRATPPASAR